MTLPKEARGESHRTIVLRLTEIWLNGKQRLEGVLGGGTQFDAGKMSPSLGLRNASA